MNENTTAMSVTEALAEVDRASAGGMGQNIAALVNLAAAVRATRTMASPAPDVTQNAGYTVRAVMPGHPAGNGLLESWYVAAENDNGSWVTWEAHALDGNQAGRLAYNAGHYFTSTDAALNRRHALADLAVRAGTMADMAERIANTIVNRTRATDEEKRTARSLRAWAGR